MKLIEATEIKLLVWKHYNMGKDAIMAINDAVQEAGAAQVEELADALKERCMDIDDEEKCPLWDAREEHCSLKFREPFMYGEEEGYEAY